MCGASAPLEWIHNSWPSAARKPGWGCATLLLDKDLFYLYRQGKKLAFLTPFFLSPTRLLQPILQQRCPHRDANRDVNTNSSIPNSATAESYCGD